MSFREAEPNRKHTTGPDAIHRIAASMIASSGSIDVIPETFPQPQRLILKTMRVLHLGGIALLIPDGKVPQKEPTDLKP